jgi:hypothetical protein
MAPIGRHRIAALFRATALAIAGGAIVIGQSSCQPQTAASKFVLRSPEVVDGGPLPEDYTGDGTSSTLPLKWSNAPSEVVQRLPALTFPEHIGGY